MVSFDYLPGFSYVEWLAGNISLYGSLADHTFRYHFIYRIIDHQQANNSKRLVVI
jgi:hypothetical protein